MAAPARQFIAAVPARGDVRHHIRDTLTAHDGFHQLDPDTRRTLARDLVRIGSTALNNDEVAQRPRPVLAFAQNAGSEYSGTAIDRMAGTTQAVLNAVSFPRFVTELINGVFKAMNESNQQQLTSFVDLIRNVAQTTEGFADSNVGPGGARQWLVEHFPSYQVSGGNDPADDAEELAGLPPDERAQRRQELQAERDADTRVVLRPGATAPTEAALRGALGLGPNDSVTPSNPEALVPLAQQTLARNRQQLLATMIQMGLQRIVIESGRLNAAMNFHIDASSAASNDRGSQFDMRNTVNAAGSFGFGPWGASANIQNTIGYVSTDRTQTSEASHADVNLSSAVELVFRTDYVPLARLAGVGEAERIRVNTINPDAESQRIATDRASQRTADQADLAARGGRLDGGLHTPPPPAAPTMPQPPAPAATPPGRAGSGAPAGAGGAGAGAGGAGAGAGGAGAGAGGAGAGAGGAGAGAGGAGAGAGGAGAGAGGAGAGAGAGGAGAGGAGAGRR